MSYKAGIVKAISELKERNGSSSIAIKKHMQVSDYFTESCIVFRLAVLVLSHILIALSCPHQFDFRTQANMPADKKWLNANFLNCLKKAVKDGLLLQSKNSYKLSADYKKKAVAAAKPKAAKPKAVATPKKKAAPKKKTAPKKKAAAATKEKKAAAAPKEKKAAAAAKEKKAAVKKTSTKKKSVTKEAAPKKKAASTKKTAKAAAAPAE